MMYKNRGEHDRLLVDIVVPSEATFFTFMDTQQSCAISHARNVSAWSRAIIRQMPNMIVYVIRSMQHRQEGKAKEDKYSADDRRIESKMRIVGHNECMRLLLENEGTIELSR